MQTINYHGWTVNTEPTPSPDFEGEFEYMALLDNGDLLFKETLPELLDMIYERTYDLKTN